MNHLPLPINPRKPHTVVPALQFDPEIALPLGFFGQGIFHESFNFEDFDRFCGTAWRRVVGRIDRAGANERQNLGFRERLCYMQSWLFFGLLILVLRELSIETSINDFVVSAHQDNDGEQHIVLDTSRLPMLRRVWRARARSLWKVEQMRVHELIRVKLLRAHELLDSMGYGDFVCDDEPHQPPIPEGRIAALRSDILGKKVHLSLLLVHEWLAEGLESLQAHTRSDLQPIILPFSSLLLRESMIRAGWCFSEIYAITGSSSARYFLSRINRTTLRRDHSRCTENKEDRDNFFFPCRSENQDPRGYRSQHANECDLEPDCFDENGHLESADVVWQCVENGYIPTLTVEKYGKNLVNVAIHQNEFSSSGGDQPFVCISHVWADGLGNENYNNLPLCQLLKLQNMVNQLYSDRKGPVRFWIDTICVPRTSEPGNNPRIVESRKMAIAKMNDIYATSNKVLVLDSSISEMSTKNQNGALGLEMAARIVSSRWMRRLWTLPEALSASKLYFRFANSAVNVDEIFLQVRRDWFSEEEAHQSDDAQWSLGNHEIRDRLQLWETEARSPQELIGLTIQHDTLIRSLSDGIMTIFEKSWTRTERVQSANPLTNSQLWSSFVQTCNDYTILAMLENYWIGADFSLALNTLTDPLAWPWFKIITLLLYLFTGPGTRGTPMVVASSIENVCYSWGALTGTLAWRWTSHLGDETICLASILGRDEDFIRMLLDTRETERMKRFILSFQSITAGILFIRRPRTSAEPFSWMPDCLLGGTGDSRTASTYTAKPTEEGLLVRAAGLPVHLDNPVDEQGYKFRLRLSWRRIVIGVMTRCDPPLAGPQMFDSTENGRQNLFIILGLAASEAEPPYTIQAALVQQVNTSKVGTTATVRVVRYMRPMLVKLYDETELFNMTGVVDTSKEMDWLVV